MVLSIFPLPLFPGVDFTFLVFGASPASQHFFLLFFFGLLIFLPCYYSPELRSAFSFSVHPLASQHSPIQYLARLSRKWS